MPDEKPLEEKEVKPKAKKTAKKKATPKKKPAKKKAPAKKVAEPKPKPEPAPKKVEQERPRLQFETKQHHEKGGSKGIFVALVLAIVVVIIAGGWYQTQQLNKSNQNATVNLDQKIENEVGELKSKLQTLTQELENQKQNEEPQDELFTFENLELGLSLQYPSDLGTASTEVIPNDAEDENDDLLRLSFSANPDIWMTFAKSTYEGGEAFIYAGGPINVQDVCPTPLEVTESGYCDTKQVSNTQVVESVVRVGEEDLLNVVKSISLPIAGEQYSGMTINLGLGLPPVTGRSLFAPTDGDIQQEALLDFYRSVIKKEGLSLVVKENLDYYDKILETIVIQ